MHNYLASVLLKTNSNNNHNSNYNHNNHKIHHLLRIPYTLNSKNVDVTTGSYVKDPEVKTIQEFDSSNISTIDTLLIREFRLYLADLDIRRKDERKRLGTKQQLLQNSNNSIPKS